VREIKKLPSKLRRVERDVLDQTHGRSFIPSYEKETGIDYEPDCLKVMQASLERYLNSKVYPKSIVRDREFLNSRKVLKGKARKLQEQKKATKPIEKFDKRRRRSAVPERPAWKRNSTRST